MIEKEPIMTSTTRRRFTLSGSIAAAATLLLVTGCSAPAPAPAESSAGASAAQGQELIADLGFEGMNAKEIITELDTLPVAERSTQFMASIRPDELILMDAAGRESAVPMPADEFYVSVAPYVSRTHECHFHSLTTCLGEMASEDVSVTLTNEAAGEVLVKETLRTYDNGFLGLWLPRGIEATLTLDHEGKSATQTLSTRNTEDATCATTIKLT